MNQKGKTNIVPIFIVFLLAIALIAGGFLMFFQPQLGAVVGDGGVETEEGGLVCTADQKIPVTWDLLDQFNAGTHATGVDLIFFDEDGKRVASLDNADANSYSFCPEEEIIVGGYDDDASGSDYHMAEVTDLIGNGIIDGKAQFGKAKNLSRATITLEFLKEATFSTSLANDTTQSNTSSTINSSTATDWQDLGAVETANMTLTLKANTSEAGLCRPGNAVVCFDYNSSYLSSIKIPNGIAFTPSIHTQNSDENISNTSCYKVAVGKLENFGNVDIPIQITATLALGAVSGVDTEEVYMSVYDQTWFLMKDKTLQARFETDAVTPAEVGAAVATQTIYLGK